MGSKHFNSILEENKTNYFTQSVEILENYRVNIDLVKYTN